MRILAFLLLLTCAPMLGHTQAVKDSETESKLVALENLWNQAAENGDLKALNTVLDEAFLYVDRKGRLLSKAQVLADVRASHGVQVSSESMYVHLHGDVAIVTGVYQTEMVDHGKRIVLRDHFLDTWRLKNGAWIAIASLTTPIGP